MSTEKKKAPRFLIVLIVILILEVVFITVLDSRETELRTEAPYLKVTSAIWIPPITEQEDDYGSVLATVENCGNTAGRWKAELLYGGDEKAGYRYYFSADSYYEQIDAVSNEGYSSNEIIPPGAAVPFLCSVDETAFLNLQELLMDGETVYVTIPDSRTKEQVYCELEISADINWK